MPRFRPVRSDGSRAGQAHPDYRSPHPPTERAPGSRDRYRRPDGSQAIPTFVVLDADLQELGFLVERPERADEELHEALATFAREHPELQGVDRPWSEMPPDTRLAVRAFLKEWRDQQFDRWTRYLFEDLAEIAKSARARAS